MGISNISTVLCKGIFIHESNYTSQLSVFFEPMAETHMHSKVSTFKMLNPVVMI
jgi:hypothetical protein